MERISLRALHGRILMVLLMVMGITVLAKAQSDTGRVVGTVADATGAYIPNATVTLTNTDTGVTETRTTGGAGEFTFPALPRGHYSVTGTASGFGSEVQKFQLDVQQVQTIDFKLMTGTTNTTVDVTDAAPVIDLATSSTGETIQGRQVTDLPLGQRNFLQLATLTPGVTQGAYGSDASGITRTWRRCDMRRAEARR